jgi:hypothetical protein
LQHLIDAISRRLGESGDFAVTWALGAVIDGLERFDQIVLSRRELDARAG